MSTPYSIKVSKDFTPNLGRAWVCLTTSGPVIRFWRPFHGWHHAKWEITTDGAGYWSSGEPCDPAVIKEVLHALA